MMSNRDIKNVAFVIIVVVLSSIVGPLHVSCQSNNDGDSDGDGGGAGVQILAQELYRASMTNITKILKATIKKELGFCIIDVDADWDGAFNFTKDLHFLTMCSQKLKGDITQRICTAAEVEAYARSFTSKSKSVFLQPNINCNLSSWLNGCEPGWACKANQKVEPNNNKKEIPVRSVDCQPCCEGFFCPHGITCMIPCPLGSYCPRSELNKTSGICEPYRYQIPPGKFNHSCGGADIWADITSSAEVFCSAGSFCPSTIQKNPCNKGFYCRTGSTAQERCFRLASCEPKSSNQNITAYGVLVFAGLCFMLIIIYNCSDQVLATRERRQAKSRERAAQSVRETQAREKWKSAKDIAKKHATELQSQLSRTFSRKKSTKTPEFKGVLPPVAGTSKAKKKDKNDLSKIINEIEENPDSQEGFNVQIGDKNAKKAPRGKALHTQSQMFRYAYGQIEKEKALQEQNKNLTFSGVISMASDIDIRKRPTIEVAFKDLTLTLKGKNKHLLRSVTGKLYPGRVSAVMGPSGAGKTTFLSALTGKATGCHTTGQVLVNDQESSITSYKKIIGFVPQDDIVHGNLTVEENLWFSARCRLSADLPKEEKVLVVERVIEALGLQAIRDSLVGTVEKRGISGGQRKRVNVGLEMVMEPSLLILDEPTSGLDSSSSQLLLRALRREALEGVNICMVLHQPSYTLFRMFDDFILLAKGGLTVYHGPVNKVEEYFSSIGIVVPDRVNPPDYYIDILEGIVKLPVSSGVNYKQLPVRWMLHNGYPVPMDMLSTVEGMATPGEGSAHGAATTTGNADDTSFAGELWQDVKCNVELKKDNLQHNFLNYSNDLSNRETPGTFTQYKYFLGRVGKQRLREARMQAVDFLILLLAGLCLGTLAKVSDESFGSTGYTYTVIAVSLLSKIAALRSFSLDKLHYWRESASGMSSLAYFLSKDTVDHFSTIVKPLVYLSMFYFFNNPRSSVVDNYIVLLCLVYCVTGIAYVLAIFLQPGPAQLWSVLLPVVLTLVATYDNQEDSKYVRFLSDLCYTKWALEAFVISNAKRYAGVWLISRCGALYASGYDLNHWYQCLGLLILTGIVSRMLAFFCMVTFQKK
ncbi:PREDICTED: ABC transporter G family member 28-like isoform X2 [Lupinus angustifolius]|uniref:ABC transporter G family member 28-like isoform X1 n=1 Tax=Lupinus angustifolius TaxID=3871 RepID=UPI00092EA3E3|nr:PREDICTED: ABC transporter G family member 28-like isoform X1 [Lupinus angustifolius]XP_019448782.1 PREDICTED: ABC transporter G family member 28-like isoform X2 [Lupinus angustifolius]